MFNLTDDEIANNNVILSGFEFVEKMPLAFFEFDNKNDMEKIFSKNKVVGTEATGKVIIKDYGFESQPDEKGGFHSPEVCVVSRAKPRRVLIFQDVEFCKQYHDNVFVIPIQTIVKPTLEKCESEEQYKHEMEIYNKKIKRDEEFYHQYYFPKEEDGKIRDRLLILSDARFVHKSKLFKLLPEQGLNEQEIKEISIRMSKMLNIKETENCKNCNSNCEKCEYKFMYKNVKGIMDRVERKLKKDA